MLMRTNKYRKGTLDTTTASNQIESNNLLSHIFMKLQLERITFKPTDP